jgi:hypothetical protein
MGTLLPWKSSVDRDRSDAVVGRSLRFLCEPFEGRSRPEAMDAVSGLALPRLDAGLSALGSGSASSARGGRRVPGSG